MANKKQSGTIPDRAQEIVREEALKIARATQSPGQTKEQTKLIAKGIANGIAAYKKQESIKQRARNRFKIKRRASNKNPPRQNFAAEPLKPGFDKLPGLIGAVLFMLTGLLHLLRVVLGTEITIGSFSVPVAWSALAGVVALALALWIVRAAQASRPA